MVNSMQYDSITIKYPNSTLEIIGDYIECVNTILFSAILVYHGNRVVYRTWNREKLGYFDPDSMLSIPDPRIAKIADKFRVMKESQFGNRFTTLLNKQRNS